MSSTRFDVRRVDWDHPAGVALRAAQQAEIAERYGTPDSEPGPKPSAADVTAFFIAFTADDVPVACGGLRRLTPTEAEVKRMYAAPGYRGTGASVAVLSALEDFGRRAGWARLVLETGTFQPDAIRFYTREGYLRIPRFGYYEHNAESVCFAKPLR